MTTAQREWIAAEIVRRIDTVTLARVEEVRDIRKRSLDGEFDGMWEDLHS